MLAKILLEGDAKPGGKPSPEMKKLTDSLKREHEFWSKLDGEFKEFMGSLARHPDDGKGVSELIKGWDGQVRKACEHTFESILDNVSGGSRNLKAATIARTAFNRSLSREFPTQ